MNIAIITGASGQDGTYLRALLERERYRVIGVVRKAASHSLSQSLALDLSDASETHSLIKKYAPTEIYHLAAYHGASGEQLSNEATVLQESLRVHVQMTANLLEGIRQHQPRARIFYASSSHVFRGTNVPLQTETTPYQPTSIYGITKQTGMELIQYYRSVHGLYGSVGILYNHESPLRAPKFITQIIAQGVARIKLGLCHSITIRDLDAEVDWGFAGDYVEAMHRILQLDQPDDFIISSGKTHTVRDFVECAFAEVGLNWQDHVEVSGVDGESKVSPKLVGDHRKLSQLSGWHPRTCFGDLVKMMVQEQLSRIQKA